jgi:hypothetical protein
MSLGPTFEIDGLAQMEVRDSGGENGMSESAAALVRTIAAVARPDARPPEDQVRAL